MIQFIKIMKVKNVKNKYIGLSLYNLKRYYESIEMYEKAIELDPEKTIYYINKG